MQQDDSSSQRETETRSVREVSTGGSIMGGRNEQADLRSRNTNNRN